MTTSTSDADAAYQARVDEAERFSKAVPRNVLFGSCTGAVHHSKRKYFPPPAPFELADALEDRNPSELSLKRYELGLQALQLTSLDWHRHWGRP